MIAGAANNRNGDFPQATHVAALEWHLKHTHIQWGSNAADSLFYSTSYIVGFPDPLLRSKQPD